MNGLVLVSRRRLSATTESNAALGPVLWNRRVERVARTFTGTFLHEDWVRVRTAAHLSERQGSDPVPDSRKKVKLVHASLYRGKKHE